MFFLYSLFCTCRHIISQLFHSRLQTYLSFNPPCHGTADTRHLVTACFWCLQQERGIACLLVPGTRLHGSLSVEHSKLNCSDCLILPIDSQTLSVHYTAVLHYCTFKLTNVDCSSLICMTSDIVSWSCSRNVIAPP